MLSRLLVIASVLLLAACATVPPPTLSVTDLQRYRLAGVTVENAKVIRSWPAQEQAYLKANPAEESLRSSLASQPVSNFPQVTAYLQHAMEKQVRADLNAQAGEIFAGKRPVQVVVKLKAFDVPSPARRVLVGGGTLMRADIDLVDPASGATVLHYEGPAQGRTQFAGLGAVAAMALSDADSGAELLTEYVGAYGKWLRQK